MTASTPQSGPASWRRRAGAVSAAVLAALVIWGSPASAHTGVIMTLHGDGRGSVWLTVVWNDNHPITEPIGAVLTANSAAGQRIGPAPLRKNGDALTYSGTLPPGEWTVVAEMGTPAIGRCQGVLRVAESGASPSEVRCATSAPATATSPSAAAPDSGNGTWIVIATVAGVTLLLAFLLYWRRSARKTNSPAKSKPVKRSTAGAGRSGSGAAGRSKRGR